MELLDFIFQLGVVFAIYGFLWGIFEMGMRILTAGRKRGIPEIYLLKGLKYFFLVNVTFLFCIEENSEDVIVTKNLIVAGIILLTYFLGKLQNSQNKTLMFQMMGREMPGRGSSPFNLRLEVSVIVISLCLFTLFCVYPNWSSNGLSRWFHESIMNIYHTPIFGFIFKIIGFFFLISLFTRMVNAFNFILSGGKTGQRTPKNPDEDDFIDYEEID